MYERVRLKPATGPVIIVHRRKGRSKIMSGWDVKYGWPGKWGTVCGVWNHGRINVTTNWELVTCMHCLKKGEIMARNRAKTWKEVHEDYKSIKNGVKYVLVMDEHGATVSMPWADAKKRKLV